MTIAEVYSSVLALMDNDNFDDTAFLHALNRGILQVNALRPAKSTYILCHKSPINMLDTAYNIHFSPVSITEDKQYYAMSPKSFYVEVYGKGSLYIERQINEDEFVTIDSYDFDTKDFQPISNFVKDGENFVDGLVRLNFRHEYDYVVRNVAMYDFLVSEKKSDIPVYSSVTMYDMATLVNDFNSFDITPLKFANGMIATSDYDVLKGRYLLIPYSKEAKDFIVVYNHKPKLIENTGDFDQSYEVLDLDEELAQLLPELIASYLLVADEGAMAQHYLNLYYQKASEIRATTEDNSVVQFKNEYGW